MSRHPFFHTIDWLPSTVHLLCARHYRNSRNYYEVSALKESLFKCLVGSVVAWSTDHYNTVAECYAKG